MSRRVIQHPNPPTLAAGVAARLTVTIMDTLAEQDTAHVLISGGPLTIAGLSALARQPLLHAVDFSRVHVWWADEELLPSGDPMRRESQARSVFEGVIAVPPTHVHPMPDGAEAAAEYAEQLRAFGNGGAVPPFDVALLDLARSGAVAGLVPERPEVLATDATVVAIPGGEPGEPGRLSVTLPVLCSGRQVWLLAAGGEATDAIRVAWQGVPDALASPASVVRGREDTLLLVDAAAAAGLVR